MYTVLCTALGETKVTLSVFSEGRSGQRVESSASVSNSDATIIFSHEGSQGNHLASVFLEF